MYFFGLVGFPLGVGLTTLSANQLSANQLSANQLSANQALLSSSSLGETCRGASAPDRAGTCERLLAQAPTTLFQNSRLPSGQFLALRHSSLSRPGSQAASVQRVAHGKHRREVQPPVFLSIQSLRGTTLAVPLWQSALNRLFVRGLPRGSVPDMAWGEIAGLSTPLPKIALSSALPSAPSEAIAPSPSICMALSNPALSNPALSNAAVSNRALSKSETALPWVQVRMGNSSILQLPPRAAERLTQQLQQAMEDPGFDAESIQPVRVEGNPSSKIGDRVLFTVTPALAKNWTCNSDQLAIQWTNRLRLAFGKVPLGLVEAQQALYDLQESPSRLQLQASWYGPYFHGRQTATGEIFNQNELTAAHPSLPFGTYLKVTNQRNGKSVIVRVNDRGPYVGERNLDLSWEAARMIGSDIDGVVPLDAVIMQPSSILRRPELAIARL